jgi:hypothetical protein
VTGLFFNRRKLSFSEWWRAATTPADRIWGFIYGAFGGLWIGLLGRVLLGPMPVSFSVAGQWALGGAVLLALVGIPFPKVVSCVAFPFAFSGFGGS